MKWISVEDGLPENSLEFICHHDGNVFSAIYNHLEQAWYIPPSYYVDVTHWMPLPEPPKTD